MNVLRNLDSLIAPENLGRVYPEYRKTFDFPGTFIDETHSYWSTCPGRDVRVGIRPRPTQSNTFDDPSYDMRDVYGSLQRPDALKIYELSYFCGGNVIDLGTSFGLSASIECQALERARSERRIDTVDLDPTSTAIAKKWLARIPGHERLTYHTADAAAFLRSYREQAGFVFVDHAHTYDEVLAVVRELDRVVVPGGFALFHDYNDWRNTDPAHPATAPIWAAWARKQPKEQHPRFGVFDAVRDGLSSSFVPFGVFGCAALFRKTEA